MTRTAAATHQAEAGTTTPELRVLSVRQPWAWQILHEGKDVENRLVPLGGYHGLLAIHAPRHPDVEAMRQLPSVAPRWADAPREFRYGSILGVVTLVETHDAAWCGEDQYGQTIRMCSPWALRSHHHLVLRDPQALAEPVAAPTRFGLWRPDDAIAEAVLRQIAR